MATTAVFAQDTKPPAALKASTDRSFDWSGWYVGGHFGYAGARSNWSATEPASSAPSLSGSLNLFQSFDAFKGTGSYFAGLHAGHNHMFSSRVMLGIEVDYSAPNSITDTQTLSSAATGTASYNESMLSFGSLRGRIGYAFGDWLAYGTGGISFAYDRLTRNQLAGTAGGATSGTTESAYLWRLGWAAGAGIEVALAQNWSARLEYLYSSYGHNRAIFPTSAQSFDSDFAMQSIRLGMTYHLSNAPAVSDFLAKGPPALELERFSLHGQATLLAQYAAPFHAPYSGQNSLSPNSGRDTFDLNFFLGVRLWEGAELWINPEIDQGFGLSGTFGVAGFPSGTAYKVGASYPYARLPRMFLRQTIDLGGEIQKVDGAINQFAGSQTSNRVVLTVGKFSSVDIFDLNKYAHDPRSDFLNWTLANNASFDYAADAWAFTYGAAVEWYQGRWTLRAGVFDLPTVPNSTDLDPSFQQFQMIGEIERRHELWGLPGKFAVTGFLSRARMGQFADAIALAQSTGTAADITAVRRYTSKSGIVGNVEQQITPEIGLFARAGLTSKEIEADAFTDADRNFATGFNFSGKLWGRPDDRFGLGGIQNMISGVHQAYLNAGGYTAIIGDGQLPHPGPEQIVEIYYSLPVVSWRLTLDYQFINNPAYNRDRGPVSVIATRLHTEF